MDERSIDSAKTASVDLMGLNKKVVNMRPVVKRTKAQVVNRLCRYISTLKKKKGSEAQKEKNLRKAERLVEEIESIRRLKEDKISKYSLANSSTFENVSKSSSSPNIRALARLADHHLLKEAVNNFREKHSDWRDLTAFLLVKQTGRKFKTKKQKQRKLAQRVENINASETMTKAYIHERFGQEGVVEAEERFQKKRRKKRDNNDSEENQRKERNATNDSSESHEEKPPEPDDMTRVSYAGVTSDSESENRVADEMREGDVSNTFQGPLSTEKKNTDAHTPVRKDDMAKESKGDNKNVKESIDEGTRGNEDSDLENDESEEESEEDENSEEEDNGEEIEKSKEIEEREDAEKGEDLGGSDEIEESEEEEEENNEEEEAESDQVSEEDEEDVEEKGESENDGEEMKEKDELLDNNNVNSAEKEISSQNMPISDECVVKELKIGAPSDEDRDISESDNSDADDSDPDDSNLERSSNSESGESSALQNEDEECDSEMPQTKKRKLQKISKSKNKDQVPDFLTSRTHVLKNTPKDPFFVGSDGEEDDGDEGSQYTEMEFEHNEDYRDFKDNSGSWSSMRNTKSMFYEPGEDYRPKRRFEKKDFSSSGFGFRGRGRFESRGRGRSLGRDRGISSQRGPGRGGTFYFKNGRRIESNHGSAGSEFRGGFRPRGNFSKDGQRGSFTSRGASAHRGRGDHHFGNTQSSSQRFGAPSSGKGDSDIPKPAEKLHPSWEASRKRKAEQSGLKAFEGTKIVFDD